MGEKTRGDDRGTAVRLAELVVALSSVADLGMGLPVGSAARTALIAVQLARNCGWSEDAVSHVFYAALLQHIGCTAYSHEVTALFADEMSIKRASMAADFTRPRDIMLRLPARDHSRVAARRAVANGSIGLVALARDDGRLHAGEL
ncbi:hypothetical protein ACWF0M_06105 [Kribbella sp. NPDC055110]